jgi:hypothetical protein
MGTVLTLAEHLTGVKLTARLLKESTYLYAVAPSSIWARVARSVLTRRAMGAPLPWESSYTCSAALP